MANRIVILAAVLTALAVGCLIWLSLTEAYYTSAESPPIDISTEPLQIPDTITTLPPVKFGKTTARLEVRAAYKISGLLVSKHFYRAGFLHQLSPLDYALIWGRTPEWLPWLRFSQAKRFVFFRYDIPSPVEKTYMEKHLSNNHLIPSTPNLRRALSRVRKHTPVELEGYLVDVKAIQSRRGVSAWNTSITRDDTGNGSCEIIYVTRLRVRDRLYE